MPRFVSTSGYRVPFLDVTFDFTNGDVVMPSGANLSDIPTRTIFDSATFLDSQVQFVVESGALMVSSGAGGSGCGGDLG